MTVTEFFDLLKGSTYLQFIDEHRSQEVSKAEIHHIYPRSFEDGRIDEDWNLIKLTKAQHLIAHILLFEAIEALDRPKGSSYCHALGAVHTTITTRYDRLSFEDRDIVKKQIRDLDSVFTQVKGEWQKLAQARRAAKWNGNCMGACITEAANRKRQKTKIAKYGCGNGALSKPESIQKGIETRRAKYGDAMGQCRTPEALQKTEKTMLERYGRRYLITDPEVKKRNREALRKKYGSCTGAMNNPISREKARKAHQVTINRKKTVVRTDEFKAWYKGKEDQYKHFSHFAVRDFLTAVGRKLEDYSEFNVSSQ